VTLSAFLHHSWVKSASSGDFTPLTAAHCLTATAAADHIYELGRQHTTFENTTYDDLRLSSSSGMLKTSLLKTWIFQQFRKCFADRVSGIVLIIFTGFTLKHMYSD